MSEQFGAEITLRDNFTTIMNNAINSMNRFAGETRTLNTGVENVEESSQRASTGLGGMIKNAISFAGGMAIWNGITNGIRSSIGAGIDFNSTMQQSIISFQTMLGSADKAKDLMQQITTFAAATPFQQTDLTQASRTLLAFGITGDKIMPTLKMLGDVSQGNKERFDSLTLAFAQISSAGKMQGQDLLQLVSAGFNPLQVISQKTGKSMNELRNEMAKGAISADMVTQAFQDATSKGGMFYNAMQNQSTTYAGLMSTLKDNFNMTFGQVMKPAFDWLSNTALPKAIELTGKFQQGFAAGGLNGALQAIFPASVVSTIMGISNAVIGLFNFVATHGTIVKTVLIGIGAAILTFGTINTATNAINSFMGGMNLLAGAVGIPAKLGRAFMELATAPTILEGISGAITAILGVNPIVLAIVAGIALLAGAAYLIIKYWTPIKTFFVNLWGGIVGIFSGFWSWLQNFFQKWGIIVLFVAPFLAIPMLIATHWGQIKTFFSGIWSWLSGFFQKWGMTILKIIFPFLNIVLLIKDNWGAISTFFGGLWDGIKTTFSNAFKWIEDEVGKFFNNPVVKKFLDVAGKVGGAIKGAINNASAAVFGGDAKPHAIGLSRVPYDNYPAILHEGESVLTKRETNNAEGKRGASITIAKLADTLHIREEADIDKVANALAYKLQQTAFNMA